MFDKVENKNLLHVIIYSTFIALATEFQIILVIENESVTLAIILNKSDILMKI